MRNSPLPNCRGATSPSLDKLGTRSELDFYATEAVRNGWSRALLDRFVRQDLYLSQGSAATNFEVTVPDDSAVLKELARAPYRLDSLGLDTSAHRRSRRAYA